MRSYPQGSFDNDYVVFEHYEYKASGIPGNAIRGGRGGTRGDPARTPPISSNDMIRLYMPNTTPQLSNGQTWNVYSHGRGPIGETLRQAAHLAGQAPQNIADLDLGSVIENAKNTIVDGASRTGGMIKQAATGAIANQLGMSAAVLTSISQGKIYNPNTELVYDGPALRSFPLGFSFVPKTALEAQQVNDIILEFKKWSSPDASANDGMYKLPRVWKITYVTNGRVDTMNRFKPCALQNVTVQANPSLSYHSTHTDGMPVEMAMTLEFKEMELITRQDHIDVGGQGY